jgi:ribosomal-protein-alanine N-acetyltransferase
MKMAAPHRFETARLVLRKPTAADAEAIFRRYASHPEVTRYLAWPTHRSIADTQIFLNFAESEWTRNQTGAYLIESQQTNQLLGATGLHLESAKGAYARHQGEKENHSFSGGAPDTYTVLPVFPDIETRALTGYVLAQDAWGNGYATEAVKAIVSLAAELPIEELTAFCHPANAASIRVLEKCGFHLHLIREQHIFPNLESSQSVDCLRYSTTVQRS